MKNLFKKILLQRGFQTSDVSQWQRKDEFLKE